MFSRHGRAGNSAGIVIDTNGSLSVIRAVSKERTRLPGVDDTAEQRGANTKKHFGLLSYIDHHSYQ